MKTISKAILASGFFLFLFIFGCVQQTTPESQSQSCLSGLDPSESCTPILDPVCGLNGRTYINCCYAQKDGATIAKLGACEVLGCNDSDIGYNLAFAGTVESGGKNRTDSCIDSSTVNEYECRFGQIFNSSVPCPSGKCKDGVCEVCIDTDSGPDIFNYGEISSFEDPYGFITYKDECINVGYTAQAYPCSEFYNDSSSPTGYGSRGVNCTQSELLREYSCKYGYVTAYYISCPPGSGCLNGKCVYG